MTNPRIIAVALFFFISGVVIFFLFHSPPPVKLQMRTFQVEPATFYRGLNLPANSQMTDGDVASAAKNFFKKVGVDLSAPGRSIAYNGQHHLLLVKAPAGELNKVEHAVDGLNLVAPQIHIKARFMEVPQSAFDSIWNVGTVVDVTETNTVEIIAADKFKSLLHELENDGSETLAEPEVVTLSGRQTQMRVTDIKYPLLADASNHAIAAPQPKESETGPTVDVVPTVMADGVTIHLQTIVTTITSTTEQFMAQPNLWDNQTLAMASLSPKSDFGKRLAVFITATVVDPAGNRVHSDGELSSIEQKSSVPSQQ